MCWENFSPQNLQIGLNAASEAFTLTEWLNSVALNQNAVNVYSTKTHHLHSRQSCCSCSFPAVFELVFLSFVGACCPSGVRLYRMAGNSLRVYWRSTGSSHSYVTEMVGSSNNYTCTASPGENSCDFDNIQCGEVYNIVVAPLTPEGGKVLFCPQRLYSGMTVGSYSNVKETSLLQCI